MPGLDPGIHSVTSRQVETPMEWIAGSSPAMTEEATSREINLPVMSRDGHSRAVDYPWGAASSIMGQNDRSGQLWK